MRKVDDGKKEKRKEKKREKNGVFSSHYVIASSLPPERLRPNDDRWNANFKQDTMLSCEVGGTLLGIKCEGRIIHSSIIYYSLLYFAIILF